MFAESTGSEMRAVSMLAYRLAIEIVTSKWHPFVILYIFLSFCYYKQMKKEVVKERQMLFLMTASCMANGLSGHPSGKQDLEEMFHTGGSEGKHKSVSDCLMWCMNCERPLKIQQPEKRMIIQPNSPEEKAMIHPQTLVQDSDIYCLFSEATLLSLLISSCVMPNWFM